MDLGVVEALLLTLSELDTAGTDLPTQDTAAIVVDLSRVPFCSAGGLDTLIQLQLQLQLQHRADAAGVPLRLVVDTHNIRRALHCLGLDQVFSLVRDRASALSTRNYPAPHTTPT